MVGGLSLEEPAADLATILSLASSYLDRPLGTFTAAIGEVGLSGELRPIHALNQRLSEIERLGFRRCIIPYNSREKAFASSKVEIIPVKSIREAIEVTLSKN